MPFLDNEEALIKTRTWTEKIADMPDESFDILYDNLQHVLELQLRKLNIPEKYRGMFLTEIGLIEQEQRYKPVSKPLQYFHIQAFHDY